MDCKVLPTCMPTKQLSEWLPTGTRKMEEQHYDAEENIYIQIMRTVICNVTDIKPGNN